MCMISCLISVYNYHNWVFLLANYQLDSYMIIHLCLQIGFFHQHFWKSGLKDIYFRVRITVSPVSLLYSLICTCVLLTNWNHPKTCGFTVIYFLKGIAYQTVEILFHIFIGSILSPLYIVNSYRNSNGSLNSTLCFVTGLISSSDHYTYI